MTFSTLIIEDSPAYLRVLEELVKNHPDLELLGSTSNYEDGKQILETFIPDLIITDIEIGDVTCFELLPFIHERTKLILVTTKPVYAVQAYEIGVVDFIVKPITQERFNKSIQRFSGQIKPISSGSNNKESSESLSIDQRIMIPSDDKYILIEVSDVVFIESLGNYVQLLTKDQRRLITYGSIKSWEERLPSRHFFQIHRSTIINLDYLEKVEKYTNETGRAYMRGKQEPLEISRIYFAQMKKFFKV